MHIRAKIQSTQRREKRIQVVKSHRQPVKLLVWWRGTKTKKRWKKKERGISWLTVALALPDLENTAVLGQTRTPMAGRNLAGEVKVRHKNVQLLTVLGTRRLRKKKMKEQERRGPGNQIPRAA